MTKELEFRVIEEAVGGVARQDLGQVAIRHVPADAVDVVGVIAPRVRPSRRRVR